MADTRTVDPEEFYASLGEFDVHPLWQQLGNLLPREPHSRAKPYVWRYSSLRQVLLDAGQVISAEEAERRALMLMNPGLEKEAAAATNLYAALQLVLPGEVAPSHRHVASALRFVIEGEGAYTTVNGERTIMRPGDLALTPSWAWHDHGNESDLPMIWLDGLDLPVVNALETGFMEPDERGQSQERARPDDASAHMLAQGRLDPVWERERWEHPYSPVVNYPWERTAQTLEDTLADTEGSETDGVIFEYTNPYTGGSALPTLGCFVQALRAGMHTAAHRHTTSAVYHVVRGNGKTVVDGEELEWGPHDTFAVPGWSVHEHINADSDADAVLFSFTDDPVLRVLGLYREETAERQVS